MVAVEKQVMSKMLVENSPGQRMTFPVDKHAGIACTGLAPDARTVVQRATDECGNYKNTYGESIPGHVLAERMGSFMHLFTLIWYVRPFGAASLLGVYGEDGPQLYLCEPGGNANRYFGTAIGKGRQGAKTEIERLDLANITAREALNEIVKIFYKLRDDEKPYEIEVSWICDENGKKFTCVPPDVVQSAEAAAKAALESDMEDD